MFTDNLQPEYKRKKRVSPIALCLSYLVQRSGVYIDKLLAIRIDVVGDFINIVDSQILSSSYTLLLAAIDGDGMIVGLSFVAGRVHLRTRFVASQHRLHESKEKKYLYRGQMGTHPNGIIKDTASLLKSLLAIRWPKLRYRNPSNTNVFYWGGKVYALVLAINATVKSIHVYKMINTLNQNFCCPFFYMYVQEYAYNRLVFVFFCEFHYMIMSFAELAYVTKIHRLLICYSKIIDVAQ